MQIELQRIHTPEELGELATCEICAGDFERGVVLPVLLAAGRLQAGDVCSECVEFLGGHPSGRFPTIEQYQRLEAAWGTPLYASREEAEWALASSGA
jgi:hypothetical protein